MNDFDWNAYAIDFDALELACIAALIAPEDIAQLLAADLSAEARENFSLCSAAKAEVS